MISGGCSTSQRRKALSLPSAPDTLIALTQYSVPLRYEDLLDVEALDRGPALSLMEVVGHWAEAELRRDRD